MKISLSNWNKTASNGLVIATGIIGNLTIYAPQFLSVLHEAPIEIPMVVDEWVTWTLKIATGVLTLLSVFTKKEVKELE
jgi:hypothetical protein